MRSAAVQLEDSNMPEYPQNPTVHRNSPTTININGKMIHCDVDFFAGHKNDTSGKAGLWMFVFVSVTMASWLASERRGVDAVFFFLGL